MMFLDPEAIYKRIAIISGSVILAGIVGFTVYYNTNLKDEFVEGKQETENLREETSRLDAKTDELKTIVASADKELKTSIVNTMEETKKVDNDLKQQSSSLKQLWAEVEKVKIDAKQENSNLKNIISTLIKHIEQKDIAYEKYKADTKSELLVLTEQIKSKDKEIVELKSKLDKEIEWRNKNIWNR